MNDRPPSDSTVASGPPTELGQDTQLPPSTTSGAESVFVVESGVERLVADWESSGSPAELTEYLPDTAAIRRAALIELIKVDLEYRWLRSGHPKRIADYCLEFPELLAEPLPPELVYLEYRSAVRAAPTSIPPSTSPNTRSRPPGSRPSSNTTAAWTGGPSLRNSARATTSTSVSASTISI